MCLVTAATLAMGCASLVPFRGSSTGASYDQAVHAALADAARGAFESADSVLAGFALRNPGTVEALETTYWRALFKLDPSNRSASLTAAIASLDGYLADTRSRQHLAEATTMRRAAAQLEALNKLAAAASSQAKDASSTAANAKAAAADAKADAKATDASASAIVDAKDAEIRKLKDDLAKANAELERIRKRLGAPPSKP